MNRDERFVNSIQALAAAYRQDADEATFMAYDFGLSDIPIEMIEKGVSRSVRESRFMPTPSELRGMCGVMTQSQRAVIAFDYLRKTLQSVGTYQTVSFDDPVINATVRNLGGWEHVGTLSSEEVKKWYRKDFERVYCSLCSTGISEEMAEPLIGICDKENQEISEPMLIETILPPHRKGLVLKKSSQNVSHRQELLTLSESMSVK